MVLSSNHGEDPHQNSSVDEEITQAVVSNSVDEFLGDQNSTGHAPSDLNSFSGDYLDATDEFWDGRVVSFHNYDHDFMLSISDLSGPSQMRLDADADNGTGDVLAPATGLSPDVESDIGLNDYDMALHVHDLEGVFDDSLHIHDLEGVFDDSLHIHNLEGALDDSLDVPVDFDAIFDQLADHIMSPGLSGNQPASQSAVDSLVKKVELKPQGEDSELMLCAVCKEEISFSLVEQQVRKLPCSHFFHGDCILPWLVIRNTCPLCRYKVPTDGPDSSPRSSYLH